MRLAIIPARGGSKRIPNKNTRDFCGMPILAYSIQTALACPVIDAVWVSTDDDHVASVALQYGAQVPFIRPSDVSDDYAVLQQVMEHALTYAQEAGVAVSQACLIFATAPMLKCSDVERGLDVLVTSDADFALSVAEFRNAPQRAQYVSESGYLSYREPENFKARSQDLTPLYHDAAQFVWGTPDAFMNREVTKANIAPVRIPGDRVVDIDTPEDWLFAEAIYQAKSMQTPRKTA